MTSLAKHRPAFRLRPGLSISPDGRTLAYGSDASGSFDLWLAPIDGGPARRAWFLDGHVVRTGVWRPDGEGLIAAADPSGSELTQVWNVSLGRHGDVAAERLTDDDGARHVPAAEPLSPDGGVLAICSNAERSAHQDLTLVDLQSGTARHVLAERSSLIGMRWSPDGDRLALIAPRSATEQAVVVVDRRADVLTTLEPARADGRPARCVPGPWSGDGLWALSDAGGHAFGLVLLGLDGEVLRRIDVGDHDIDSADIAPDESCAVVAVNRRGSSEVRVISLHDGSPLLAPTLPPGVVKDVTVDRAGRRACLRFESASEPPAILAWEIGAAEVTPLVQSAPRGSRTRAPRAAATEVRYASFDGEEVPAWLVRPRDQPARAAVISVHGGPQVQERPTYAYGGLYQHLAAHGITVLAPNVRGSAGYGRAWQEAINRDWGGGDLQDVLAGHAYLVGAERIDPRRIGVFGVSYGGFCALSCLTRHPESWAAGVSFMGPADLVTFVETVPETWRPRMRALIGDPVEDREHLVARSPLTYAHRVRAPLYLVQGGRDRRVPRAQGDAFVASLREHGIPVSYDVFDDEGHVFADPANEARALDRAAGFLTQHLLRPIQADEVIA